MLPPLIRILALVCAVNPLLPAMPCRAEDAPAPAADAAAPPARKPEAVEAQGDSDRINAMEPEALVGLLGHKEFRTRAAAESRLKALLKESPDRVRDACYAAYERNEDPEVWARCRSVLLEYVVLSRSLQGRGFVGIGLMLHPFFGPDGKMLFGVRVTQVMPNLPGAKAGLRADDLIVGVDDILLDDQECDQKFMDYIGRMGPGKEVKIKVLREAEQKEFSVTLARRPETLLAEESTDPEKLFREFLQAKRMGNGSDARP